MKIRYKPSINKWIRNRYAITSFFFVLWILFFDAASVSDWVSQMAENNTIKRDIEFYTKQIETVENQLRYMHSDRDSIEKYARETFYMKQSNEEIFIIE